MCTAEVTTPESIICKTHTDCIPVRGLCNEVVSINKKFLSKHDEISAKVKDLVLCQNFAPAENPDYIFISCEKAECTTRKTPTKVEEKLMAEIKEDMDKVLELQMNGSSQECYEAAIKLREKYPKSKQLEQLFFSCQIGR